LSPLWDPHYDLHTYPRDRKQKRDDKGHDEGRERYGDRGDSIIQAISIANEERDVGFQKSSPRFRRSDCTRIEPRCYWSSVEGQLLTGIDQLRLGLVTSFPAQVKQAPALHEYDSSTPALLAVSIFTQDYCLKWSKILLYSCVVKATEYSTNVIPAIEKKPEYCSPVYQSVDTVTNILFSSGTTVVISVRKQVRSRHPQQAKPVEKKEHDKTELGYKEILLLSSALAVLTLAVVLPNLNMEMDERAQGGTYDNVVFV
ncbi:hypothetical protein Tco_0102936, partial [Tanacetum coccineum]